MAKKKSESLGCGSWVVIIVIMAVLFGGNQIRGTIISFAVFVGVIVISVYLIKKYLAQERVAKDLNNCYSIIDPHIDQLRAKRSRLTIVNDYGYLESQKWLKEVNYFLKTVVGCDPRYHSALHEVLSVYINNQTQDYKVTRITNYIVSDGTSYEYHVKEELESNGWNARVIGGSGDQGIDIIATKSNIKLAIQCKNWKNTVGNRAVQEIYSGKIHVAADFAVVITSSSYTPKAYELAHTTRVVLIHTNEIKSLDEILGL